MPNTRDLALGGRFMGMFIGENGCGKTIAEASWYEAGPIKIYDFDGRMRPVKFMYPQANIEYTTVGAVRNRDAGIIDYKDFCREFENLQDDCPWETVCIDSFTSMSVTAITYQLSDSIPESTREKVGRRTATGFKLPGFDEYNSETTSITQIIDVAKVLPCNVIFTAHPIIKTRTQDKKAIEIRTIASYGNKIAGFAPGYFDEVYWFEVESSVNAGEPPQRKVFTQSSAGFFAKTALPLPGVIDITNKRLFREIQSALKAYDVKLQEVTRRTESV